MILIYFLVAMLSTSIGAIAGIGGGVIIKPVLDLMGGYNLETIGILSAFTVFFMAIVSIIKQIRYRVKIEIKKTVFIGIGSIIGGILGDGILRNIIKAVNNDMLVIMVQNSILAILLVLVFIYMNSKKQIKTLKVENELICILIGAMLGTISSFLSIGGGPINVCVLVIFFSMNTKEAAINSIITILFSQLPKVITAVPKIAIGHYDLSMLPVMIIGGIIGGIVGSNLNKKFTSNHILKVLNVLIILLILLNSYNVFSMLI